MMKSDLIPCCSRCRHCSLMMLFHAHFFYKKLGTKNLEQKQLSSRQQRPKRQNYYHFFLHYQKFCYSLTCQHHIFFTWGKMTHFLVICNSVPYNQALNISQFDPIAGLVQQGKNSLFWIHFLVSLELALKVNSAEAAATNEDLALLLHYQHTGELHQEWAHGGGVNIELNQFSQHKYSRVPNESAGCLLDNEKQIHLHYLINKKIPPKFPFSTLQISKQQFPPKPLFLTIHLFKTLEQVGAVTAV